MSTAAPYPYWYSIGDKTMKRLSLALLLASVVACGGGGSDPVDPPATPALVVPDGTFALTASMSVNGCGRADAWAGDYDLHFDGKTFTMGGFAGSWDPNKGFARGEADRTSN